MKRTWAAAQAQPAKESIELARTVHRYVPVLIALLLSLLLTAGLASATEPPAIDAPATESPSEKAGSGDAEVDTTDPIANLKPRFRQWLRAASPFITVNERRAFLRLTRDYQRDAFIDRFWRMRDPFPETARNELKERWERTASTIEARYETFDDDRARILLTHGMPQGGFQVRCTTTRIPAEVWVYQHSEMVDFPFFLVFIKRRMDGPAFVLRPDQAAFYQANIDAAIECINGRRLTDVLSVMRRMGIDYQRVLVRVLAKPRPRSEEWLATFAAFSTDVAEGTTPLNAAFETTYPGRRDSRTVLQGLLTLPHQEITFGEFAGHRSADFLLVGEVVAEDRLFENFRYKFGFPAASLAAGRNVPLAFQRLLRPGTYRLILRLEDLNSHAVFRHEQDITVPKVERVIAASRTTDSETARLFTEATEAISAGETTVRIIPPSGDLHTGLVRIDTLAVGDDIKKVSFFLDERLVMTKNRPPYNVEIDLGEFPQLHTLRVEAYDSAGRDIARDEALINAGGNRFAVRLTEPVKGRQYEQSLQARAEVETPDGREVDRVEFFVNEDLIATLYQPPYSQPIVLPQSDDLTYVRAVAYLPDGNFTEDLVFVNAPEYLEELDVQFVELYTSAFDGRGRPIQGLTKDEFQVSEDGVPQSIERFEEVRDLPIHAGILIDNSGSMRGSLEAARKAALSFFEQAITPRDRAAVITFNKFPHLAVKLTNNLQALGGGLAGLTAEGETALYDSLIFSLYYFAGIKGQRALLVLSDGRDEASKFTFEEALEYARRAGVTVYTVGLNLGSNDARRKLAQIADETGGRSFFIGNIGELDAIYQSIQEELRSQYLIAYQSSNTAEDREFRSVELETVRPGVKVKTISGYYP
ncbi:MAG: VWA domain-containing protein [Acidobacteriota bacterium]